MSLCIAIKVDVKVFVPFALGRRRHYAMVKQHQRHDRRAGVVSSE